MIDVYVDSLYFAVTLWVIYESEVVYVLVYAPFQRRRYLCSRLTHKVVRKTVRVGILGIPAITVIRSFKFDDHDWRSSGATLKDFDRCTDVTIFVNSHDRYCQ